MSSYWFRRNEGIEHRSVGIMHDEAIVYIPKTTDSFIKPERPWVDKIKKEIDDRIKTRMGEAPALLTKWRKEFKKETDAFGLSIVADGDMIQIKIRTAAINPEFSSGYLDTRNLHIQLTKGHVPDDKGNLSAKISEVRNHGTCWMGDTNYRIADFGIDGSELLEPQDGMQWQLIDRNYPNHNRWDDLQLIPNEYYMGYEAIKIVVYNDRPTDKNSSYFSNSSYMNNYNSLNAYPPALTGFPRPHEPDVLVLRNNTMSCTIEVPVGLGEQVQKVILKKITYGRSKFKSIKLNKGKK